MDGRGEMRYAGLRVMKGDRWRAVIDFVGGSGGERGVDG